MMERRSFLQLLGGFIALTVVDPFPTIVKAAEAVPQAEPDLGWGTLWIDGHPFSLVGFAGAGMQVWENREDVDAHGNVHFRQSIKRLSLDAEVGWTEDGEAKLLAVLAKFKPVAFVLVSHGDGRRIEAEGYLHRIEARGNPSVFISAVLTSPPRTA